MKVEIELDELYALRKELEEANVFIKNLLLNKPHAHDISIMLKGLETYENGEYVKYKDIEKIIKEIGE